MIRHLTALSNVNNGQVVDPLKIKHGVITALKISQLSGWIDPPTHLNIDFPEHLVKVVNVAEDLSIGSKIVLESERFMSAYVDPRKYSHLGVVDEIDRMEQLKEIYHRDLEKTV